MTSFIEFPLILYTTHIQHVTNSDGAMFSLLKMWRLHMYLYIGAILLLPKSTAEIQQVECDVKWVFV